MKLDRREFLKLATLFSASTLINPSLKILPSSPPQNPDLPNILIIVFDAFSAENIPFYGYPRNTTPNINQLLNKVTVYHQHYAASNFTTTGTSSLLTGVYPWKHRAFKLWEETVQEYATKNIFSLFNSYYRIAYTHNLVADVLLKQFNDQISQYVDWQDLYLTKPAWWGNDLFTNDFETASLGWLRTINPKIDQFTYSLFLRNYLYQEINEFPDELLNRFPRGLPETSSQSYFLLEDATAWIESKVTEFPSPYLGYFHLFPPHAPYSAPRELIGKFNKDGYLRQDKGLHPLTPHLQENQDTLNINNRNYDEYILYLDLEFGKLFDSLERSGKLDNTYVILTSDHGEAFERGYYGHESIHLHQPLVRIPLVIFEPGQTTRRDIHQPTSAVDLIPTLLHITDQPIPSWQEGSILPPYNDRTEGSIQSKYAYYGYQNPSKLGALETGTMMLVKDQMKAIRYFGYKTAFTYKIEMPTDPYYEVYNLEEDPEELNNLANTGSSETKALVEEIDDKYNQIKHPYEGPTE